jgi:hypothetical protein
MAQGYKSRLAERLGETQGAQRTKKMSKRGRMDVSLATRKKPTSRREGRSARYGLRGRAV